ncbi:YfiR family protein [Novosphingobium kaempferiae]|uniref:YfiR family protein n=1 Tax=Novosphingobium kaempferiae TaxID=2896849 RepID=UPI001E2B5AAA|nr:YfiR family protein [Novosphingobium kaempferiae]
MGGLSFLLRCAATVALFMANEGIAEAQMRDADALRAALVFNIIRFVDFPDAGSSGTLILCVVREATNGAALASLRGQRVGSQIITVRAAPESPAGSCNVLYMGAANAADITRTQGPGMLLIGEGANFIGSGGTVGLVQTGRQIRFEINMRAARRANVVISSQLLRLASRVQQ